MDFWGVNWKAVAEFFKKHRGLKTSCYKVYCTYCHYMYTKLPVTTPPLLKGTY